MGRFRWTTFYVNDMEASIEFYTKIAGLAIDKDVSPRPGTRLVFLNDGDTKVELIKQEGKESFEYGPDISIGIQVDDLEMTLKALEELGIEPLTGILSPAPYIKFFYVSDPSGVKVQFSQDI